MTLNEIEKQVKEEILKAATKDALFEVEVKYLGKKGVLSDILKSLGKMEQEERKKIGAKANSLKKEIETLIKERQEALLGGGAKKRN